MHDLRMNFGLTLHADNGQVGLQGSGSAVA